MKLFKDFEAVKFTEEDMIFITNRGYLYYIYDFKYNVWKLHRDAGNTHITVSNYQDVSVEELTRAMNGIFPQSEIDFIRLCIPEYLCIRELIYLLEYNHPDYMMDYLISCDIKKILSKAKANYNIHKTYEMIDEMLEVASINSLDNEQVQIQLKNISLTLFGKDIFKEEIGIVDGHDGSSYFWIMPVRVINFENTSDMYNVSEMKAVEISIEEDDVDQYLSPFLYRYFDDKLKENENRENSSGFEWNLEYNYFTFNSIELMLKDIKDTIDALTSQKESEYTKQLKIKRGFGSYELLYAVNMSQEDIADYNANRPKEDNTDTSLIIDFYKRFIYRMEYMMKIGKENGFNLISFMGP